MNNHPGTQRVSHAVQRILVVRTDRLGDVVLTLPMLSALKRCFPGCHLTMLLSRYTGAVVEGNRYLDGVLWVDGSEGAKPFWTLVAEIRKQAFDAAIVVRPTFRIALAVAAAGVPVRVGTGYRWYSALFNRRVLEHRKTAARHELEYNLNLLTPLGCTAPPHGAAPDFGIVVDPADLARVDEMLRGRGIPAGRAIVVIHPGSGGSALDWPVSSFGELAKRLLDTVDASVVVTGTAGEVRLADAIVRATGRRAVSLCGALSLPALTSLLSRATLFVSNSTGPIHIAAALGVPVLGFYPQIPVMGVGRWGPYTSRRRVLVPDAPASCTKCSREGVACECMASIGVDSAVRAAHELLALTASPTTAGVRHG